MTRPRSFGERIVWSAPTGIGIAIAYQCWGIWPALIVFIVSFVSWIEGGAR